MKKYLEPLLIGVILIVYGLRSVLGNQLLIVVMAALAIVYLRSAFQPQHSATEPSQTPETADDRQPAFFADVLLPKISGISAAISVFGVLYSLMHWDGAAMMLIVGGGTQLVLVPLGLMSYFSTQRSPLLIPIARGLLIGGLAIFMFSQLPPVAKRVQAPAERSSHQR